MIHGYKPAREIHEDPIVGHAHTVSLLDHANTSIVGAGLRDEEIIISLIIKIYRQMKSFQSSAKFPLIY